ncbi:MAG: tetratricopeptide repeat protein [Myxococcaceae bacterium]|nr:tetratricopeptide repeat protein [Myxococcaceae bacterium]
MAKSMVERYEQLLLQDPSSSVFVELAKVLLEKGEPARALEVCQQGLAHHANSVIGRVLWGKALLQLGKPAQAMEQFDQAIAIDKENAHAYNLIGEVLVQRGLFRSALPILRKAVALQPNDGRVRLWLEQTQQALSGGPAPVLADLPGITANALAPKPLEEEQPAAPPEQAPAPAAEAQGAQEEPPPAPPDSPPAPGDDSEVPYDPYDGDDATRQFTAIQMEDFPSEASPPAEGQAAGEQPGPSEDDQTPPRGTPRAKVYMFPPRRAQPPAPPTEEELADTPPPFAGREEEDTQPGAEAEARTEREEGSGGLLPDVDLPEDAEQQGYPPEPETQPDADAAAPPASAGGGLLGDLPPPDEELPAVPAAARVSDTTRPARARGAAPKAGSKRSLLDDIPEDAEPAAQPAASRAGGASDADAAAIAAAYEKELREKIAKSAANPSFLARYGLKLAVGGLLVVVLGVGLGAYLFRRARQGGQTLAEVLERTERVISQDTRASLREALALLERAYEMDEGSSRAWALKAYSHALLYADHGGLLEDRQAALSALEQPEVRARYLGLSLSTDLLVADARAREPARRAVLAAQEENSAELHTLAGTLLLEDKKPERALEHFKRALELSSRNVRALVELGHYYQDFDDHPNALKVYASAREISPEHPVARIGLAESRLAMGEELDAALTDMQALSGEQGLQEPLRSRQQLIQGRLLAELGQHDEALRLLTGGTKGPLAFEFHLALGEASRAAGKLQEAEKAYLAALGMKKSEAAREGLVRTLLDRDRVKEALKQLEGAEGRRVSLVRAAAYARQGEWKKVRAELEKTRVNNRYPPEAVSYLAMADTMNGEGEQAREVLEKAVGAVKRPRTELRVALGRVHWKLGSLAKAQSQFEEAMKDSRDYEGACALGRLLLTRGLPDMALKPLTQAVQRNGFHGEAREALGLALLALGRTEEGFKQFEAWKNDSPDSVDAQKGYALALLRSGRRQEAADTVRSVKLATDDAQGFRLRSVILFSAGDARGGLSALERSARINSQDPETYCEIAHLYLRQDKPGDAEGAFEKARTDGPDVLCGLVGEHYAYPSEGGRSGANALRNLASKATTVWDKAFVQTALARVLLSSGDVKGARAAAEEAVKLDPVSGRAHLALGLVAARQRQEEPALAALTQAVELDPTHGMARLALADALARKPEELPRAIQEYETFLKLAGSSEEAKRVKKNLPNLKRRVK